MSGMEPDRAPHLVTVAHVADAYRCYPGDTVTFYTRVDVEPSVRDLTLRVVLPAGVTLDNYQGPDVRALPRITLHEGANSLIWHVERDGTRHGMAGEPTHYEYQAVTTVAAVTEEVFLESRAVVTAQGAPGSAHEEGDATLQVSETVRVVASPQGHYLDHLPAIYREDDLMGRFLMLFESFWAPVSRQIDVLHNYFDPYLTPPELVPWLASWIDLVLDEHWPLDKRRQLLAAAVALYRKRGTRQGMEEYLEIYAGTRPKIVEHRAHNFRLGAGARLGPGIALGRGNEPHTFTVVLSLPPASTVEGPDGSPCEDQIRRRRIEAIIEAEKPAHTGYQLRIETEGELEVGNRGSGIG